MNTKPWPFFILFMLAAPLWVCGQIRMISFYEVPWLESAPPRVDGRLNDAAWETAPQHQAYYQYFVPNPPPGMLKTEHRMLYNERGLYLAIINYEEQPEKLRMRVTDRDNNLLWTDDCAEIYIDHYGNAIGYRRFVVNALGTMGDMMRLDGAVTLNEWSGDGWIAKTGIEENCWIIEAFFPWSDLGRRPEVGDIWRFCHVRYAYTSGKFIGVTSSAGGNYSNTGDFGFLSFQAAGQRGTPEEIGAILGTRVAPPWALALGEELVFDAGDGLQHCPLQQKLNQERQVLQELIEAVEKRLQTPALAPKFQSEFEKLLAPLSTEPEMGINQLVGLNKIYREMRAFDARLRLELEFN